MVNQSAITGIYNSFATHGPAIDAAIRPYALDLFGVLLITSIVWSVGWSLVHKTDIMDILAVVTRLMIVGGFFLTLLQNWGAYAKAIVDTGARIGGMASVAAGGKNTMGPAGIFEAGTNMAGHIWKAMSWGNAFLSFLLGIAGIIVLLVFVYIAALVIEILIESFVASYIGVVMMAFGGAEFTRDMAISQIRYAIAVAVKLMTMHLIIGISQLVMIGWSTTLQGTTASLTYVDAAVLMGLPVFILRMAQRIPNMAQDAVNGAHISSYGNPFTAAATIARAAEATAIAVTGAAAAVTAGAALASKQMGASIAAGTAPSTRVGQAAKMSSIAVAETGKALASDVGKRLTGNYSSQHGSLGWRVASNLSQQAKATDA